jgi:hypothetical protein
MGRKKITDEEKKHSISIALKPALLEYFRGLHINLSSLINKLFFLIYVFLKIFELFFHDPNQ